VITEWNIQPRAAACQNCGRRFSDGQPYHTLLFDEKARYRRLDVCPDCWQTQFSLATDRRGFVSYWQGVYQAPPPKAAEPIQRETAETLLRKLLAQNDPQHLATIYILAVMLERKRVLKVKDQLVSDGRRTFIYEHARTGDVLSIVDPGLRLDQLEQVQRDVAAWLARGTGAPTSSEPVPEAAAASFSLSPSHPEQVNQPDQPGLATGSVSTATAAAPAASSVP